jgi:hypothetical protein
MSKICKLDLRFMDMCLYYEKNSFLLEICMKNIIYIFVIVGMSILSGCSVEKKEITALSTTSQPVIIEDTCQTEIIESDVR